MASGDVALELLTASVSKDDSGPAASGTGLHQETTFTSSRTETVSGSSVAFAYVTTVARDTTSGLRLETLFDASKQYKITITEV